MHLTGGRPLLNKPTRYYGIIILPPKNFLDTPLKIYENSHAQTVLK